ncbi:hypothetical protein F5884DRAFT_835448 [Xylogone sp. PMI_703]|nr:hypothetical protein F5884DRAFT_835448 [Xylogone sp. PMI_703]
MVTGFFKSTLAALSVSLMLAIPAQAAPATPNVSIFQRQISCPVHQGPATFFCSGTSPTQTTACGNTFDPNAPGVAISTLLIPNADALAQYCGLNVVIGDEDNGNEILAPIIDLCATCDDSEFHIDLSLASFQQLSENSAITCEGGGELFNTNWFVEVNDQPCF